MEVTLLGTGSALPSPERVQSGVLVADGPDSMLVDCGSGVVHRMARSGVDHRDISTVLLTHHHLDHVADLPTLVKARVLEGRTEFRIVGPPGTETLADRIFVLDGLDERADIDVEEFARGTDPFEVAGMHVHALSTQHTEASHAYRIGDRLVISGDTPPEPAVFALADGAHTLVHECGYPDGMENEGHTTPAGLLAGIENIQLERLVLTHLFPAAERAAEDILGSMQTTDVSVELGEDGMVLAIPPG